VVYDEHITIRAARHGSRKACNALYNRHVFALFRFLRQYSANEEQVEDWVQRAFIKALTHIESFNESSRFSTWLFTIALNEIRTDKRRQPFVFLDTTEIQEFNDDHGTDFEWRDAMKILLNDLDIKNRTIFLLYEVEGYSHAEIGSMLGITENLSRTILCRTKTILRRKWESVKDAI
jgi:RNA polymerase sigma factor (sigma-70 family)